MTHVLKIRPEFYHPVSVGLKTFEVRKNDRGFQAGDVVRISEWDPEIIQRDNGFEWVDEPRGFTDSPVLEFKIGYVLPIDAERVVFSLLPLEPK